MNAQGQSKAPGVYFLTGQHNQFVFFDNARPAMKIFSVVELPSDFGAAANIIEDDGFPIGDDTVDKDSSGNYQCLVK